MDEQLPGVTPAGGDTPQEDNAASETEALEAEEVSQDAPRTPDAGGDGEQEEADDVTDRGTRPAKEPESRYYQQVKNENVSTIDGVKIWFNDKSAILIRPSGTEPVFRLYAEAKDKAKALKLVEDYSSRLKSLLKTI